jgi:hypothetical protein
MLKGAVSRLLLPFDADTSVADQSAAVARVKAGGVPDQVGAITHVAPVKIILLAFCLCYIQALTPPSFFRSFLN